MRLVGIGGFKTSGKDSTFRAVQKAVTEINPELVVARTGFADKLKIMAALALGLEAKPETLITLMDDAKENWDIEVTRSVSKSGFEIIKRLTGRQYLQWFGGHARTVFGETFWIDQVLPNPAGYHWSEELSERYPNVDILCITDVRYQNEAQRVERLHGEVWRVERPGLDSDGHSSEVPLPNSFINHVVHNNGTLDELEEKVARLL